MRGAGGERGRPADEPGGGSGAAGHGASHAARGPVIAIDGPAGAGKSTLARRVARAAGLLYLDTGAMYRAVALAALRAGHAAADGRLDAPRVAEVAAKAEVVLGGGPDEPRVWLDGEDVTRAIRTPEVDRLVPLVARLPAVRAALVPLQRRLAGQGGVVVDGRDIGTEVLPHADWKFFVTAAFEARVERRLRQLRRRGLECDREAVARDLRSRDALDEGRAAGALRVAPGAVRVDTTRLSVEEAVGIILERCGLGRGGGRSAVRAEGAAPTAAKAEVGPAAGEADDEP